MPHTVERIQRLGASRVSIGRFTYGTENVSVRQWGEGAALRIGAFCSIASAVNVFLGGNHRSDWATPFPFGHIYQEQLGGGEIVGHPQTNGDVTIGDDVWIAHGVTIMSGVTVGAGAVLAINATVLRDVAPYQIVGGNPAKPIRQRFGDDVVALLLELRWWDLPVEVITAIAPELSKPPEAAALKELIRRVRP